MNNRPGKITFDIDELASALERRCPELIFALLHGSAKDGAVCSGSDIDLAVFVQGELKPALYANIHEEVMRMIPAVKCDIGILNRAEPVYRFEVLKGRLLFSRDMEKYLRFFSLTCREYEDQIADYKRQRLYRIEARKMAGNKIQLNSVRESPVRNETP
jgi:predicted nucleotidyltransferase